MAVGQRQGWLLCAGATLLFLSLCSAIVPYPGRPELANFEALEVVPEQSLQDQFNALDAELLTKVPAQPQQLWEGQEDGYEPYSDEMDAYVTYSGMPHPLDDDLFRHNRYEFWKANYKRIPNEKPVSWSYDGPDSDPDLWSSLKKEYSQCDPDLTGSMSSPIDIPVGRAVDKCYGPSFPLKEGAEWDSTDATIQESFDRSFILDVMHCTQACKICKADCSEAPTVKKTIEHPAAVLDRVIFHTPSEHKLDGEKLDMEIQLMHCVKGESYHTMPCAAKFAIAVMFRDGGDQQKNPKWIDDLFPTIKSVGKDPKELANGLKWSTLSKELSPLLDEYYGYIGSETQPPCHQGVQWMVAKTVIPVSSGIIKAFSMLQGDNVRPAFPLGKRELTSYRKEADDHWTYRGPRGQQWWGTLIPSVSCGEKKDCEKLPNQGLRDMCLKDQAASSPIDLYTSECMPNVQYAGPCVQPLGLRPVKFDLGKSNDDAVQAYLKDCDCMPCTNPNNAYTFALHVPGKPTFTYYNTIYELKEVTFHTPTEHAMEGQRKAMEVQLHMEKTGCVTCGTQCCTPNNNANEKLKYAILFDEGQSSPSWVTKLASAAVGGITATPDDIAPDLFFRQITVNIQPLMSVYYIYQGAETTPPCHSGVTWLVMKQTLEVSSDDLKIFKEMHVGDNARDLQDLNGRAIEVAGTIQL